jgi:serine/threonine-protein kinase
MSRLFLATERSLERRVVVKILPPELVSEASAQRFQREMLLTARLQHAHILPVLSAGARNGLLYYVTPYITGESLRRHIEINGALPVHMTMRLLREVADALGFAHRHGVVHRDLKPANIFLQHGHAILADFGIARAVESATAGDVERLTRTGAGLGTPGYMSPEQLAGDANVDARADIYAVGVVAYEMLAGEPPFAGLSGPKLVVAHMIETPEPIEALREDVPIALAGLIRRCLEKEPERRWQSVDEMVLALDDSVVVARATDPLEDGVAAFERREWRAAFDALCAADTERPLAPEQLEQLADAAWWIGKSDDCIRTRERAYARYMESDDHVGAARVALALAED